MKGILVPQANRMEAAVVDGIGVIAVDGPRTKQGMDQKTFEQGRVQGADLARRIAATNIRCDDVVKNFVGEAVKGMVELCAQLLVA